MLTQESEAPQTFLTIIISRDPSVFRIRLICANFKYSYVLFSANLYESLSSCLGLLKAEARRTVLNQMREQEALGQVQIYTTPQPANLLTAAAVSAQSHAGESACVW